MKKVIIALILGVLVMGLVAGDTFSQLQQQTVNAGIKEAEESKEEAANKNETKETSEEQENQKETNSDLENNTEAREVDHKELQENKEFTNEGNQTSKKVFLTFDDGPTTLTPKVLDILKEHDVNATFFTIGRLAEKHPEILKRTYNEGNMVLPHSYTHDYSIYSTIDGFYEDFYKAEEAINNVLDIQVPPIFRFPGGSSNHSSFDYGGKQFMPMLTEDVKKKGYYYIDWNVSSGDAGPDYNNKEKMIENVLTAAKNQNFIIVLFHDVPRNTKMVEALPEIIAYLKNKGYVFRTFGDITEDELDTMVQLKLANKPIVR